MAAIILSPLFAELFSWLEGYLWKRRPIMQLIVLRPYSLAFARSFSFIFKTAASAASKWVLCQFVWEGTLNSGVLSMEKGESCLFKSLYAEKTNYFLFATKIEFLRFLKKDCSYSRSQNFFRENKFFMTFIMFGIVGDRAIDPLLRVVEKPIKVQAASISKVGKFTNNLIVDPRSIIIIF